MTYYYKRLIPWTNEDYINFKKELNAMGVKITPIKKGDPIYNKRWTKERIRVKYTRDDEMYEQRLKNIILIFCKYLCEYSREL